MTVQDEWKRLLYTSLLALYVADVLHILSWILFCGISDVVLRCCPCPSSKKGKTGKTLNHTLPSFIVLLLLIPPHSPQSMLSGPVKLGLAEKRFRLKLLWEFRLEMTAIRLPCEVPPLGGLDLFSISPCFCSRPSLSSITLCLVQMMSSTDTGPPPSWLMSSLAPSLVCVGLPFNSGWLSTSFLSAECLWRDGFRGLWPMFDSPQEKKMTWLADRRMEGGRQIDPDWTELGQFAERR